MIYSEANFIAQIIEKVMKGVRKQMKGYVTQLKNEFNQDKLHIKNRMNEFQSLYESTKKLRIDFCSLSQMIDEGRRQRKMMLDMEELYNEMKNLFMDMQLLMIEKNQNKRMEQKD